VEIVGVLGRNGRRRKEERKRKRERNVEQRRANKIDICTEWKREIVNNKMTNIKIKR
jgi:hypothetical protein